MSERLKDLSALAQFRDRFKDNKGKQSDSSASKKAEKSEANEKKAILENKPPKDAEVSISRKKQDSSPTEIPLPPKGMRGEPKNCTLLAEIPYNFVPIAEKVVREKREKIHQVYEREKDLYSGKLKLKITTLVPLHIGSGRYHYENGIFQYSFIRKNGQPVIPGSSFRGAVRSVLEAVSHSCVAIRGGINENLLGRALPPQNNNSCTTYQDACPACRLFGLAKGKGSSKGLVEFTDFIAEGKVVTQTIGIPGQNAPFRDYPQKSKDNKNQNNRSLNLDEQDYLREMKSILRAQQSVEKYGNERLYYCMLCENRNLAQCYECTKQNFWKKYEEYKLSKDILKRPFAFRGRKFYYHGKNQITTSSGKNIDYREFVPKNTSFVGEIYFRNLTLEDYGLLLYSLGLGKEFYLKLGYGKPLFFGTVEVSLIKAEKYRLSPDLPGVKEAIEAYKNSAKDLEKQRAYLERWLSWEEPLGQPWPGVIY